MLDIIGSDLAPPQVNSRLGGDRKYDVIELFDESNDEYYIARKKSGTDQKEYDLRLFDNRQVARLSSSIINKNSLLSAVSKDGEQFTCTYDDNVGPTKIKLNQVSLDDEMTDLAWSYFTDSKDDVDYHDALNSIHAIKKPFTANINLDDNHNIQAFCDFIGDLIQVHRIATQYLDGHNPIPERKQDMDGIEIWAHQIASRLDPSINQIYPPQDFQFSEDLKRARFFLITKS